MTIKPTRTLTLLAGLAWLVVVGTGVMEAFATDNADWAPRYVLFSTALLVGAVTSVAVAGMATRQSGRSRLRIAGLAVCGLGCLAAVVAWALPLWMTLLGVGFVIVAVASEPRQRRAVALLAAGQLSWVRS